jgi:hypothetical protein
MKKLFVLPFVFALFFLVSEVVAIEDATDEPLNSVISFLVKSGGNDDNSPLSAIIRLYSISKDDTLNAFRELHNYAFSKGSDSPYFKKLSAIDDSTNSRLCKLYDGCLTGRALKGLKKELKDFGGSFLYGGNTSPYVYPPAKLIGEKIVNNDGRRAKVRLNFKGTGEVVFGLERTEAGWRINEIEGDYCNVGD